MLLAPKSAEAPAAATGIRLVPLPPTRGVFNPIKGTWAVAPADARAAKACDIAPRPAGVRGAQAIAAERRGRPVIAGLF